MSQKREKEDLDKYDETTSETTEETTDEAEEISGKRHQRFLSLTFEDPISLQPMHRAVITPCGHSFSEETIQKWLLSSSSCPICKLPVHVSDIKPNYSLRAAVSHYQAYKSFLNSTSGSQSHSKPRHHSKTQSLSNDSAPTTTTTKTVPLSSSSSSNDIPNCNNTSASALSSSIGESSLHISEYTPLTHSSRSLSLAVDQENPFEDLIFTSSCNRSRHSRFGCTCFPFDDCILCNFFHDTYPSCFPYGLLSHQFCTLTCPNRGK